MDNIILVPGEIIGVEITTIPRMSVKHKAKLVKYQVVDKDNMKFLPCIYAGTNKKGRHQLIVADAQQDHAGRSVFTPTEIMLSVKPSEAELVFGKYMGIIHGTVESLPTIIPVPGFNNVGIQVHIKADHEFEFTSNIEKNISAVAKHAKSSMKTRALIYGPPSSGRTSLSIKMAEAIGQPWIIVSPKWLTIGTQGAMGALAYAIALASQRKMAILFDDVDELLGLLSGGGEEDEAPSNMGLGAYYFILETIKNHPMPLIFNAVGRFPIDHIISQCNVFFSLHFSEEDIKNIWAEICPTAKELGEELAEENMPLAMMYAVMKQAEMVGRLHKRKTPNKDDVKTALTCFGRREESKVGFRK